MNRHQRRASVANGRAQMAQGWTPFVQGPSPVGHVRGALGSFVNSRYVVFTCQPVRTSWGLVDRLMIRRNDGGEPSWRDKQRIKDELLGKERTAVEVFPPQGEIIDVANIYHLWVLPAGKRLPFGLAGTGRQAPGTTRDRLLAAAMDVLAPVFEEVCTSMGRMPGVLTNPAKYGAEAQCREYSGRVVDAIIRVLGAFPDEQA